MTTPKNNLCLQKTLLCVWWDIHGIIHYELLKPGETITADVYCAQLEQLKEALLSKRPGLINRGKVILQLDNACPHATKKTREKIKKLNWEVLPHPSYSPDLAPSDYHLFCSMQHFFKENFFKNLDEVKIALEKFFRSKSKEFYKNELKTCKNGGT